MADFDTADQIAIVGMAGRFPGADDPDALWRLLAGRGDAIVGVPAQRWDATAQLDPEREVQAVGGFLDGVDQFDAGFFGISPREAEDIDPQQRLMLEMTWRALEDAGQPAAGLAGTRTGVYVGASWHDYEMARRDRGAPTSQHSLVGNALDVIAARVSYALQLRGPSLTVETGCSSSLVALHLAAQALRSGEIDAAVVGGVNLILAPDVSIGLTHFGGLSPDGRCAAFAADANGFVRGEGVAAILVKRLDRALREGARVHGVLVRSVVNNDGGGESLVTPSPEGQRELLRLAYGDGAVPLDRVGYVEAHGTGTGRGDPIEAGAIGEVLGRDRTVGPLPIGSVKTNIGHLEAAAGMAGLFKVLLALRHRTVPPSLHSATLNPEIPFDELNVTVVREQLALPTDEPVYLGVNSFGWGGTNAHVVVGPAPAPTGTPIVEPPDTGLPPVVPLSARQQPALARLAGELADRLPGTDADVAQVAGALAWHRDHFPVRAAVLADRPAALRDGLARLAAAGADQPEEPDLPTGRAVPHRRTAFVFPGQGSQWRGMGRDLYKTSPVFADVIRRCAEALRPHVTWDLSAIVADQAGDEWTTRIDMLQPTLWAMSLGLAELWRANGVHPDLVLGHSQGEITAATLAGAISYEDGALLMARRSAIARRTSGRGLMLAVDLDRDGAREALKGFEETVSLAVHNGPRSCVLSGDRDDVLMLKELLDAEEVFCRLVNVDYASHSPQMAELRDDLLTALAPVRPVAGTVPLLSTVQVGLLGGTELDAAYWVENLCRPVLFADAMRQAFDDGITHVVEVSPHPVLTPAVEQLAAERAEPVAVLSTLRRDNGTAEDMARALARSYVAGLAPFGGLPRGRRVDLPGYPMQPERYWPADRPRRSSGSRGFEVELSPAPGQVDTWHAPVGLTLAEQPWLADHRVHDAVVLPGAAMLALLLLAARARTGGRPGSLDEVAFAREITFAGEDVRLTVEWRDDVTEGGSVRLLHLPDGGGSWTAAATARASYRPVTDPADGYPAWANDADPTTADDFYRDWAARGLRYGPAFRPVRALRVHPDGAEAVGEVVLADRLRAGNRPHTLHPALADGALQVALALCPGEDAVVPVAVDRILLHADLDNPPTTVHSHVIRHDAEHYDVRVFDDQRQPVLTLRGLRLRPLTRTVADTDDAGRLHRLAWTAGEPPAAPAATGRWLVCGPAPRGELVTALRAAGADPVDDGNDVLATDTRAETTGVIFVAPDADAGLGAQRQGLLRLTAVARACAGRGVPPRFAVVTARAQAVTPDDRPDPGAALYWGYLRALRREHGELDPRLIDVDPAAPDWAARCAAELLGGEDDQVALRADGRRVGRLARGDLAEEDGGELSAPRTTAQPFRVTAARPGRWESVVPVPLARRAPGPGEVEVEVTATGLNFIDVMKAVGTYPDPSGGADALGGECAGRVVAVGDGVTEPRPGDRVVACAFGSLASHVTVRAEHTRPVPAELADAAAAALPLAYTTAWYALADLGRLAPGETVLVHSAAGGVGLAAVQVAHALGGRVVATAGSEAKRDHLRALGVADVFDSRDLGWAAQVRAATGGRGVDLVLNSLTGAAIPLGLDLLAEDGRFVEIGKKDIYAGRPIGLDAFRKGITLSAVDLAGLMDRRPERFGRLLADVWHRITDGTLSPLPTRVSPFAEAAEALREMSHGNHIGKLVVADPTTVGAVAAVPLPAGRLRPDTYLISGGLGALGLSLAEFLVAHGAGGLVLLGRSAPNAAAQARVAALRRSAAVEVLGCDVADEAALRRALDAVRGGLPPVRGVFHAAGLLDDATVGTLTAEQVRRVLAPKVDGALALEAVTADDPLDLFVLFSSAAALIGNAGQAAYGAANAWLDAFAEARRRAGRPALSVQWGPFGDVGLAAADENRGARLAERGMESFATDEAWPALLRMLGRDEPVVGYVPLNLRRWFDAYPDTAGLPSWQWLRAAARDGEAAGPSHGFRAALLQAPAAERAPLAETKVRELAGRVLRLDADRVDRETPFKELGLDSLMGLELRNRLEQAFGLRLSPTLLWTYGTAQALAGALCEQLARTAEPSGAEQTGAGPDGDPADQHAPSTAG
ncbi:SDR family NAD(P)-dependent oxidoreductase [Micromonospora sp. NPDC093277]|uniref:SDR family NAD(P)-dependent oxidoreductase n=1 Tax=Micromonospora sp. NPDC093277 TaxID=3364291 RepID=UPI0037FC796D